MAARATQFLEKNMKAIIWTKYGSPDGLKLREVLKPAPKDNEVLIKIHAATASTPDSEFRRMKLPLFYALAFRLYIGLIKPSRITILGGEFAGEIEAVGKDVTRFEPGDQVFGYTGLAMGTYAEYVCLAENPSDFAGVFAKKPTNMSYEEATAVPFGGLEALHSLQRITVQAGQKILIVGAGGSIGTWTVQLAKHYGMEVTGVDHTSKLEMLHAIGADHVVDYTREKYTKNGIKYDVIVDTINKSPFRGSVRSLKEKGIYINAKPSLFDRLWMAFALQNGNKQILTWSAGYDSRHLVTLKELIEAGKIKSVIDRSYPLEQIADAHRYVDTGQKKGNVIITIKQ
jgi:NADPH:quinone reductase-like Zn-dependent oxidoreductase